jgi:hypothetical protein
MAWNPRPPTPPVTIGHGWRFAVVLLASLLLAVAQPLAAGLFGDQRSFDVLFSLLILAVMLLVFEDREHRKIALGFGVGAFFSVWIGHGLSGLGGRLFLVGAHLLATCFFGFALYGILRAVLGKRVSGGAIFGALCGYLLLGIIWSLLYSAVETASPGSFALPASKGAVAVRPDRGTLVYYSFVTLATVGYGDVTPLTPLARTLAWLEAVTGQFYLAVLVAGLVGLAVTHALTNQANNEKHDE